MLISRKRHKKFQFFIFLYEIKIKNWFLWPAEEIIFFKDEEQQEHGEKCYQSLQYSHMVCFW